jgi:cobalt/nickel transport system permease protein
MPNFVEKTILDIQTVFDDLFYFEETTRRKGLLQTLDPRIKLLSFLALIIIINFCNTISGLAIFSGYIVILALCSRIPMLRYLRRVLVIAFIFTGLVVFPSIFNVVRPGAPMWRLTPHFYITRPGLYGAVVMMLRSFCSLLLIYLLTATTQWVMILRSLRTLKVPSIFVATLEMTERYIFLGLELAANLLMARKSRSLGKSSGSSGRRFIANTMGNL